MRNIFLQNHAENEAGRLVQDLTLFFEKVLFEVEANDQHLRFSFFGRPRL